MLQLDNTRLSDFKKCPRYYYLRHVRHWVEEGPPSPAILFGQCWHSAMDQLWQGQSVEQAMRAFLSGWYAEGLTWPLPPSAAGHWGHHTPDTARKMLESYALKRTKLMQQFRLVAAEKVVNRPLTDDIEYVARIDKVVEYQGEPSVIEHKTTGYGGKDGFTFSWKEYWHLSAQLDGYRWLVGSGTSLWIDAALVSKITHDVFDLISIRKNADWETTWLWEARFWARLVQSEHEKENMESEAFPRNTNSCRQFNRLCEYFSICRWTRSPREIDMPAGFIERKWDPTA